MPLGGCQICPSSFPANNTNAMPHASLCCSRVYYYCLYLYYYYAASASLAGATTALLMCPVTPRRGDPALGPSRCTLPPLPPLGCFALLSLCVCLPGGAVRSGSWLSARGARPAAPSRGGLSGWGDRWRTCLSVSRSSLPSFFSCAPRGQHPSLPGGPGLNLGPRCPFPPPFVGHGCFFPPELAFSALPPDV